MDVVDALPDQFKRKPGRPKGSGKLSVTKITEKTLAIDLPKTEQQRIRELKDFLMNTAGSNVVLKTVEIAMNDDHPAQASMIKLLMDRTLPVSMFEKEKNQRSAVTINITGIGDSPISIGSPDEPEVIDVEDKNG